jgi:hypothetical protein
MNSADSFIELVSHICLRRRMYVSGGTFYEVCAYLAGYSHASPNCPLSGEGWTAFNQFICAIFRFPDKYDWPYVLRQCSLDEDEATARLHRLLTEFAERTKTESHERIVGDALARARVIEEAEPVKAWRRFSRAIHRGSKGEIEPLIQDHPDADILWSSSYPDDVVPLLDQIEESYLMSTISGSEDDGEVTIITPDFGPVEVKRIGGIWRIDASKIINCWKANRDRNHQPPVIDG